MNKSLLLLLVVSLTVFSCENHHKAEKLSQVDSLIVEIQIINKNLSDLNVDSINLIIDEMREVVEIYLNTDPKLHTNDDFKLFDYSDDIHRKLTKFMSAYSVIQKEITYTEHQLNDLKLDIENDQISDSVFTAYLDVEKKIISRLHTDLDSRSKILELYNIVKDDITVMVKKLKASETVLE